MDCTAKVSEDRALRHVLVLITTDLGSNMVMGLETADDFAGIYGPRMRASRLIAFHRLDYITNFVTTTFAGDPVSCCTLPLVVHLGKYVNFSSDESTHVSYR